MMSTIFYLPQQYFIKGVNILFIIQIPPEGFIVHVSMDILHIYPSAIWFSFHIILEAIVQKNMVI